MRAFDPLVSPGTPRGSVPRRRGRLVWRLVNLRRQGPWPKTYGVSATFPIFFAVLNEMMDRRLRRRNVRAIWQLAESSSEDELAVGAIDCPLKCVNRI
jgi:hypothetical protein